MATPSSSSRTIQSVSTLDLYNRWAKVYDTDGNMLQSIDDLLLPGLLKRVSSELSSSSPITITELGCGTGRNTTKLLASSSDIGITKIHALDLSPSMLDIARSRCQDSPLVDFHVFDALTHDNGLEIEALWGQADFVLSTLVLEHLPIDIFFRTCASFIRPGGLLVVTNMHAEMGRRSQAGFMDDDGGTKVQGESFNYEVEEVVSSCEKAGFKVVEGMEEREIRESDIKDGIVGERGVKWVACKVWFGGVFKYEGSRDSTV